MCKEKKIVLYGAGIRGKRYLTQLIAMGYQVCCFVDRDPQKIGTAIQNIPVFSIEQLKKLDQYSLCITPKESKKIIEGLACKGIPRSNMVSGFEMIASMWIDSEIAAEMIERKKQSGESNSVIFDCENGFCLGGVENWCLCIGEGLDRKNYKVRYIAKKLPIELPEKLEKQAEYVRIQKSCMFEKPTMEDILAIIIQNIPCTVITSMPDEVMVAACAVKKVAGSSVRIISVMHNDTNELYQNHVVLDKYIDAYICVSEKIQIEMKNRVSDPDKVFYRVSPVPYEKNLERSYSKGDQIKLGYAGRIVVQQKRMDLLVPLLMELKKRNVNYKLGLAGEGDYLPEIQREIQQFELDKNIAIHGRIENSKINEFWKQQDICINLSDHEGRSISVMEAMVSGVVPVVTDTSGNEDIKEGKTGFIVGLEEVAKMADIIEKLSKDKKRLAEIGKNAREAVIQKCDSDAYLTFIEKLI